MSKPESNGEDGPVEVIRPVRRTLSRAESLRAARGWWDAEAGAYQAEHGEFLGDADFLWGPEGLRESEAGLLGAVDGRRILEIGAGAAQCSRWLAAQGAHAVALDLSATQLAHARRLDERAGARTPLVLADAQRLPFGDATFDLACSAYGAVPFAADSGAIMADVARVLRPGGRWVFSVTHPIRWSFPDDAGPGGLTDTTSFFDRRPYVEVDETGTPTYVEHHRTLGDRVREIVAAGLVIDDLIEPEWPSGDDHVWGQWSRLRGEMIPGTAIFRTSKPG